MSRTILCPYYSAIFNFALLWQSSISDITVLKYFPSVYRLWNSWLGFILMEIRFDIRLVNTEKRSHLIFYASIGKKFKVASCLESWTLHHANLWCFLLNLVKTIGFFQLLFTSMFLSTRLQHVQHHSFRWHVFVFSIFPTMLWQKYHSGSHNWLKLRRSIFPTTSWPTCQKNWDSQRRWK